MNYFAVFVKKILAFEFLLFGLVPNIFVESAFLDQGGIPGLLRMKGPLTEWGKKTELDICLSRCPKNPIEECVKKCATDCESKAEKKCTAKCDKSFFFTKFVCF